MNSKRFPEKKHSVVFLCLLLIALGIQSLFLVSCKQLTVSDEKRLEKELTKQFSLYIQYRRQRDIQKVYSFYSDTYKKKVRYEEWLQKEFPENKGLKVSIIEYGIENITFSENYTEAVITYFLKSEMWTPFLPLPKPQELTTHPEERWVLVDGVWYREPFRVLVDISGSRFYVDDK